MSSSGRSTAGKTSRQRRQEHTDYSPTGLKRAPSVLFSTSPYLLLVNRLYLFYPFGIFTFLTKKVKNQKIQPRKPGRPAMETSLPVYRASQFRLFCIKGQINKIMEPAQRMADIQLACPTTLAVLRSIRSFNQYIYDIKWRRKNGGIWFESRSCESLNSIIRHN